MWSQWKQDGIVLERNGIKKQFFWLTKKKLYANLASWLCWGVDKGNCSCYLFFGWTASQRPTAVERLK